LGYPLFTSTHRVHAFDGVHGLVSISAAER